MIVPKDHISGAARWPKWMTQLFLSWNLAWMAVWVMHSRADLGPPVHTLYTYVHTIEPEVVVAQTAWSCVLGLAVFFLVWVFGRFRLAESSLRILAGVIALAGFPVIALFNPRSFFQSLDFEDRFAVGSPWLICEVTAVLVCALVFYIGKWRLPTAVSILLCALHFGFWSWLTGMHVSPLDEARGYWCVRALHHTPLWPAFLISIWFYWAFPVLGFLAAFTWATYTDGQRGKEARA